MDETGNRLSDLLTVLGYDRCQKLLDRFSEIIPFPLLLIDIAGQVIAASKLQHFDNITSLRVQVDQAHQTITETNYDAEFPYQKTFVAPVLVQNEVVGYVGVCQAQTGDDDEKKYLRQAHTVADIIADKAYTEYELDNLTEELIERYNEVNLIYDITEALSAVLDSKTVCNIIIKKAVAVIGVERASVMLYHTDTDQLYMTASYGLDLSEEEKRQIRVIPGEGISGTVFRTGEHILTESSDTTLLFGSPHAELGEEQNKEAASDAHRLYKKKSFLSVPMVCTPMNTERKVMGVINMTDKIGSDMFTSGDLRLLTAVASQAAISLYNIQLIEEVKDAERVKREMEIAQQIQTGLLPNKAPLLPGIELAGRCLPATQVGGDYYDFFLCADNKLGLVIADVSGHNVGAALMMAAARSTLRSEVLARKTPAAILKNTNLVLYDDLTHADLFITMFYAEYDLKTRTLQYSNGGHNHPIVLHQGNCTFLNTDGMLIGVLEFVDFEEKTIRLEPDDVVVFYTDGVVEAKDEHGKMFTVNRLCHLIEANQQHDAHKLLNAIYAELEYYSGSTLRADDTTVVVLKIH